MLSYLILIGYDTFLKKLSTVDVSRTQELVGDEWGRRAASMCTTSGHQTTETLEDMSVHVFDE